MTGKIQPDSIDPKAADVFSRGALQLTYTLLRKKDAQLALTIRNITGGYPQSKQPSQNNNQYNDYFRVDIDSLQVRAVVENLGPVKK